MEHETYRRMAQIQDRHWWYVARRRILGSLIGRLDLPPRARILEAGSGTGSNLRMLAGFGTVQGFEPDEFAREAARDAAGIETRRGFLPDDVPYPGPFDLVGAFDVIEHVEKDAESLATLCRLTAPGGYAVLTVPAFMFLWSRHDEINHHVRRYRLSQLEELLSRAGYRVEFISYYNMLLFPLVAAVRLVNKVLKRKGEPDDALPRLPFVNAALCTLFSTERFMLAASPLPFGVSIIAVCRKP